MITPVGVQKVQIWQVAKHPQGNFGKPENQPQETPAAATLDAEPIQPKTAPPPKPKTNVLKNMLKKVSNFARQANEVSEQVVHIKNAAGTVGNLASAAKGFNVLG